MRFWSLVGIFSVTWLVFTDEVVFHVAAVVVPLVQVRPAQTRRRRWLVVHDDAGLPPTGRLVRIPVPVDTTPLQLLVQVYSSPAQTFICGVISEP